MSLILCSDWHVKGHEAAQVAISEPLWQQKKLEMNRAQLSGALYVALYHTDRAGSDVEQPPLTNHRPHRLDIAPSGAWLRHNSQRGRIFLYTRAKQMMGDFSGSCGKTLERDTQLMLGVFQMELFSQPRLHTAYSPLPVVYTTMIDDDDAFSRHYCLPVQRDSSGCVFNGYKTRQDKTRRTCRICRERD